MNKSTIEWHLRGYPYEVKYNASVDVLDWCNENLNNKDWVKISKNQVVFSNTESAILFQLAFG